MSFYMNPPAFPVPQSSSGMSLRDWFAGQALSGILSNPSLSIKKYRDIIEEAYRFADAMLAERGIGDQP